MNEFYIIEQSTLPRYALEIMDKETGKAMEYRHLTKLAKNKFGNDGQDFLQIILATYHKALVEASKVPAQYT